MHNHIQRKNVDIKVHSERADDRISNFSHILKTLPKLIPAEVVIQITRCSILTFPPILFFLQKTLNCHLIEGEISCFLTSLVSTESIRIPLRNNY